MSESEKPDTQPEGAVQELNNEELDQISGGPTAVERILNASAHPPSLPSESLSLNFTKIK